jgi:hypothetical protein
LFKAYKKDGKKPEFSLPILYQSLSIMQSLILKLHEYQAETFAAYGGQHWFLIQSIIIGLVICRWGIPITTDMMVNASAGLAGKHLGEKHRTLVINASTNNPELANMLVSIGIGRVGGIGNPLGSNFANIYLMYLLAPIWLFIKWMLTGNVAMAKQLWSLLKTERKLVFSHILMAGLMFGFSTLAYWMITGVHQFSRQTEGVGLKPWPLLFAAALISLVGITLFMVWDRSMQRKRPELFDSIDSDDHKECWKTFFIGTGGLILVSLVLNGLFLAWSTIYSAALGSILGAAIFAGLHYFVGALVTSLPELRVATENYAKLNSPDLNTALASASASNMTNLAIAVVGLLIVAILSAFGVRFVL